jgi:hypothetical protein
LIRRATQDKNLTANSDGQLKLHFEAARTWMGTDYRATIHTWKEVKRLYISHFGKYNASEWTPVLTHQAIMQSRRDIYT